jgi:histidine triad (HIT) family protein
MESQPTAANGQPVHCTFCDLIHGAAEVSICHEDSDAIAFMDIQPVNNGHVLVVPRAHYESLLDVPEEIGLHLFKVTMRLANAIRKVTGCNDLNIVVNSGAAAGQDEPHYHVHIIPRREGDGFDVPLPFGGSQMPDRTVLDAYAARIISALTDPMRVESNGSGGKGKRPDVSAVRPSNNSNKRSETPVPMKSADPRADRSVALPVFDESGEKRPSSSTPAGDQREQRSHGRWRVREGAHGELLYEPNVDSTGTDDAA